MSKSTQNPKSVKVNAKAVAAVIARKQLDLDADAERAERYMTMYEGHANLGEAYRRERAEAVCSWVLLQDVAEALGLEEALRDARIDLKYGAKEDAA